jgi:hypothetical protein
MFSEVRKLLDPTYGVVAGIESFTAVWWSRIMHDVVFRFGVPLPLVGTMSILANNVGVHCVAFAHPTLPSMIFFPCARITPSSMLRIWLHPSRPTDIIDSNLAMCTFVSRIKLQILSSPPLLAIVRNGSSCSSKPFKSSKGCGHGCCRNVIGHWNTSIDKCQGGSIQASRK